MKVLQQLDLLLQLILIQLHILLGRRLVLQ